MKKQKGMSPAKIKAFVAACKEFGIPAPIQEHMFAKETMKRKWRIDFYFWYGNVKVALEVEGGVYTGGRHTRPVGFMKDIEKYNALATHGILLVRCTPSELLKTSTLRTIHDALFQRYAS